MDINKYKIIAKEKGQASIFLGIALMIIISFMAFVINVGLFVKAKINLQNAVDAAAYAGASVQARQLTNVAYLNWELRNTFKEWMFKYYVLGQKGITSTELGNIDQNSNMNFRLKPFYPVGHKNHDPNIFDRFNVPSICIHYGSPHNICEIVSVPGLPRFDTVGLPSISKHHTAFIESIVKTKANDCSTRSNINLGAAMLWAFGTGDNSLFSDIPQIASTRPGAWVEAFELGIRIRNLESIINQPPRPNPICATGAAGGCEPIENITSQNPGLPLNERVIKSFYSAYRNISGGKGKDNHEFARTFKLTELSPTPLEVDPTSLSGFLIPASSPSLQKHYVDLQIYPINYINFFTLFSSSDGSLKNSGTKSEADCASMKAALPVPGYILGFTKNHQMVTYYAVKGEAKFIGLFYPFADATGINLTAYAAAKPIGGRIGPKLFDITPDSLTGTLVEPRRDPEKQYTSNYASALILDATVKDNDVGVPLPSTDTVNFWADETARTRIGGNPTSAAGNTFFVIPNMIYDFDNIGDISNINDGRINRVEKVNSFAEAYTLNTSEKTGLYNGKQFFLFASNQDAKPVLAADDVIRSIFKSRRATKYDAINYLVPTLEEVSGSNRENFSHNSFVIPSGKQAAGGIDPNLVFYNLFGPLFGPNTLYPEISSITNTVVDYVNANTNAFDNYLNAMKRVADDINARGGGLYNEASKLIYNEFGTGSPVLNSGLGPNDPSCAKASLAQKFATFFKGEAGTSACGITPIADKLIEYFNIQASADGNYSNYYSAPYTLDAPNRPDNFSLMTGYMPGTRQGADASGNVTLPGGTTTSSKRNFYSTKIFAIDKITQGSASGFDTPGVYLEGSRGGNLFQSAVEFRGSTVHNVLEAGELSEFKTLDQ